MSKKKIAPSILAADFANLQSDVEMLNESQADFLHIDIMDGVFVPNISFGFPVCEAIHKHAKKPMDFHLMVTAPDPYLESSIKAGAKMISVHYEACNHLHRTISRIRELGAKAGVAINPHLSVEFLKDILPSIDFVVIMSVNPGFGGQKFIENTFQKVKKMRQLTEEINPSVKIEVDGGVTDQNAARLVECGADILVVGSYVFKAESPSNVIAGLKA